MNSLLLFSNNFVRNSNQIKNLLNRRNDLFVNEIKSRGLKRWQENTLKLMYKRSRLFDAVQQPPQHRSVKQEWYVLPLYL